MNKKEVIEKIKKLEGLTILDKTNNFDSEMISKKEVFNIINQIDELEKPVVPQYVADMIVKRKEQGDNLIATLVNLGAFGDAQRWIRKGDNGDTFAKAWLFGYEIEKEKLYTARVKGLDAEYGRNYVNQDKKNGEIMIDDLDEVDGFFKVYFTKEELEKLGLWDNVLIKTEEVEE